MSTAYLNICPDGLGVTLDRMPPDITRAVVCGPRPGAGKTGATSWAGRSGRWVPLGSSHITRSSFRGRFGYNGSEVLVTRAEPWFGLADAATVEQAAPVLRHLLLKHNQAPMATPGRTGLALLSKVSPELVDDCPPDIAALLVETSGQGRFQVFGCGSGVQLVAADARFQYGALSLTELPCGVPVRSTAKPSPYAPSWLQVEFTPADNVPFGLLGVRQGKEWLWPTTGRNWSTWATGAEVHLAQRCGYDVRVTQSVVWPGRSRPLARFGRVIIGARHRVGSLPLPDPVRDAVRTALRSVLVQTVGSLHAGGLPVLSATADNTGSPSRHPEWTTALYGLARTRLAQMMLRQTAPVVGCALDGFYVAGCPVITPDDGLPGSWVVKDTFTTTGAVTNLADLYRQAAQ